MIMTDVDEIQALAPWFHNLHLPDGRQTCPGHGFGDFPAFKWRQIAGVLPADLTGWRCLDIGCNAGFYSLQLAQRGGSVLAIDVDGHYLRQARWAQRHFDYGDRIEFRQMQVYELAGLKESFDLVLFMGVFYHLRYPMLGLDIVCEKVRRLMLFQTLTMPGDAEIRASGDVGFDQRHLLNEAGWPKMAFLEHGFAGDPTNWWAPNHAACESMLRAAGMVVTQRPGHELYLCEPNPKPVYGSSAFGSDEYLAATGRLRPLSAAAQR